MKFRKVKIEFTNKRNGPELSRDCELLDNGWVRTIDEEGRSVFYPPHMIESLQELVA